MAMACNRLVTCPYDEVHKVKESRLSLHITKCRLNHLDEEKFICPFNATHVLPMQERDYHLRNCSERAPLDRSIAQNQLDKNNPFKGNTSVPSYTESVPTATSEVWDIDYSDPRPGFVINRVPPACAIIEPPPLAKPAERRRLYQELHRMPTEAEKIPHQSKNEIPKDTAIHINRQPKAPSQAEHKKINQEFQNLGLGRGRAPAPPNRIAANIFSISEPISNSGNYSAALTSGMSNLGLGRGLSVSAANNSYQDDDEFPALGYGRGVSRRSKNATKYPGSRN